MSQEAEEVITEDSEHNYEWDNYRENPSFVLDPEEDLSQEETEEFASPVAGRVSSTNDRFLENNSPPPIHQFVFDHNEDNQYSVWPPRHPSSESQLFEETLLPRDLLASINEEGLEDDVFFDEDSNLLEEVMPPKTSTQIHTIFKEKVEEFDELKADVDRHGKPPSEDILEELKELNKAIRKSATDLKKSDPNISVTYPEVGTTRSRIQVDLMEMLSQKETLRQAPAPATDSREETQEASKNVAKLTTEFSTWEKELANVESKIIANFNDTPEPNSYEVADTEKLLKDLRAVEESAKPLYIKLVVEVSEIDEEKRGDKLSRIESSWKNLQNKVSLLTRKGQEYASKFTPPIPTVPMPGPTQTQSQTTTRSTPLERLPLPIFKGVKANYLKFKQKFETHVKYNAPEDRLMALQEKCLTQESDKKMIENEVSLEGCWEKLDQEYGDKNALVAEIFSNWFELKSPKTDKEFVEFVKQIEYGVTTIESLGHAKDVDASQMSVLLEKKLPEDLRKRFCRKFTDEVERNPNENRMRSFIKFLQKEKKSTALGISSYTSSSKKNDENTTATSATGIDRDNGGNNRGQGSAGRGGGSSRGNGRGGGSFRDNNRGGYQGGGNGNQNKRGEPNKKCLYCDGDHATSKCGNLRDKSNKKTELLGLAVSFQGPFCTYCMEPGHSVKHCKNDDEEMKCPCGDTFRSIYICCKTDDCKTRKNWPAEMSSSTSITAAFSTVINGVKMGETLLPIQMIPATEENIPIRVMFDNCSQSTFILNKTAAKLGIKGLPINYILVCTDGTKKPMTGHLYKFLIRDLSCTYISHY